MAQLDPSFSNANDATLHATSAASPQLKPQNTLSSPGAAAVTADFLQNSSANLGQQNLSNLSGSYRNPWTSVSRPMNGFIDIRQDQWEQNELRKAQLAKDLRT